MPMKFLQSTIWSVLLLLGIACGDILDANDYKIKNIESNPSMAVPLAFGSLSIKDLLKDADSTYVKVKPDGLVYLAYDSTIASATIRDVLVLKDINIPVSTLNIPGGTAISPAGSTITSSKVVSMGLNPEKINEIGYRAGDISYAVTITPANPSLKVKISIPEITKAGVPYSVDMTGSGTFTNTLTNYIFTSAIANQFTLNMMVTSTANITPPATTISVSLNFINMRFNYVKGFFGDRTAQAFTGSLPIQAFGTSLNGATISFAQPTFNFSLTNEFGVPAEVTFFSFKATKPSGDTLHVDINPASPLVINPAPSLGSSSVTNVTIINTKPLLDFGPTNFSYKVSPRINKNLVSGNNFMADTSKLKLRLNIEIPLYGKASGIKLLDTIPVSLSSLNQSKIDKAFLKININNEIPLEAVTQFYFLDSLYNTLDILFAPAQTKIVPASVVNASGLLVSPGIYDTYNNSSEIELSPTKLNNIFKAKYILVEIQLNTSKDANGNQVDVKFMTQYRVDVKLGLLANMKLDFTL